MNDTNWGGSRPGAGRKSLRDEAEVISILDEAVSRRAKVKIVKALVKKAEDGDIHAARLIMSYTFGRPIPVEKAGDEIIDPKFQYGMSEEEAIRAFESDLNRVYGDDANEN